MKLILVHGDDTNKSYERLYRFIDAAKKRDWNIERFSASENIADILVSRSLFDESNLYILEDAEKLNKTKLKWLKDNNSEIEGTLVLFSGKTLNKTLLNSLPKIDTVEEFKLSKIIWSFLDSLYPGNATNSLKLFHKLIEKDAPEFVFSLMAKQIRDMYYLKVAPNSINYPSWRKNKLTSQMRKYDEGQLEKLIMKLAEADLRTKTSHLEISDLLDFIIVTELE